MVTRYNTAVPVQQYNTQDSAHLLGRRFPHTTGGVYTRSDASIYGIYGEISTSFLKPAFSGFVVCVLCPAPKKIGSEIRNPSQGVECCCTSSLRVVGRSISTYVQQQYTTLGGNIGSFYPLPGNTKTKRSLRAHSGTQDNKNSESAATVR